MKLNRFCGLGLMLLWAGRVQAQEIDAIGDLLDQAARPAAVAPAKPILVPHSDPVPAAVKGYRPVMINELDRTPDDPPTASEQSYVARVRATFEAAQDRQGPLEGGWLIRQGGVVIYEVQLVDRGQETLEGAWVDARRRDSATGSGFMEEVVRSGTRVTLKFRPGQGRDHVQVRLESAGSGSWSGQMIEGEAAHAVTMVRR